WSSDVCSSDLVRAEANLGGRRKSVAKFVRTGRSPRRKSIAYNLSHPCPSATAKGDTSNFHKISPTIGQRIALFWSTRSPLEQPNQLLSRERLGFNVLRFDCCLTAVTRTTRPTVANT